MAKEIFAVDEIRERISQFRLSPVALKILEVANDERAPVQSLAVVIGSDPLFAARLLRVVNLTPGLPQKFLSVFQAISVLGFDAVKSLAMGLTLYPFESCSPVEPASEPEDQDPITVRQFWEHSLGCAVAAGRIATRVDHGIRHQSFIGAFLHDLGRILFYRHFRDDCFVALKLAAAKKIPLREAELQVLGMDHVLVGELWAVKGDFPLAMQQIIRYHHEPLHSLPHFIDAPKRKTLAIVHLADLLCEEQEIGKGGDAEPVPDELWNYLQLRWEDCAEDLQLVRQEIEGVRNLFGLQERKIAYSNPPAGVIVAQPATPSSLRQVISSGQSRGQVIQFPFRGASGEETAETSPGKKLTILVVEDHGSLCDMLSLYFMRYGYHVRTANNGETALEILSKEEIHLVLLDLMLPRMDGFTVLRRLRDKQVEAVPYIIVVSAGASEKDRSKVLELGANEYMPKPFHLMRLLERVQMVEKYLL